jgi:hypothetical protein
MHKESLKGLTIEVGYIRSGWSAHTVWTKKVNSYRNDGTKLVGRPKMG